MIDYVKAVLDSKGIHLPEGDYEILAQSMEGLAQLRKAAEEELLDTMNMQLFFIPGGGERK